MKFAYTYRSSDGQRHAGEIDAPSRDEAFAALRGRGIRPIRVTTVGGQAPQDTQDTWDAKRRVPVLAVLGVLGVLALSVWWQFAVHQEAAPYQVLTPQGPVTLSVAAPLARQMIPGDRRRIEEAITLERNPSAFRFAAEVWLARYAEPGRPVVASDGEKPTETEFATALKEPIRIASTDFTEVVDLKRIVVGMKREMKAYLAGGGTAEQYLAELEKRQRLEISYRESAERRLADLLSSALESSNGGSAQARPAASAFLRDAYDYWLKANAHLQSMGIWPLPLPDALRAYQMNLDIDE